MADQEKISLVNIKDGAVVEMFDRCIDDVMENIEDINTVSTEKRVITLKITFKPTEDRGIIGITAECNPKFSNQRKIEAAAIFKNGAAYENKPKQQELFSGKTIPMEGRSQKA